MLSKFSRAPARAAPYPELTGATRPPHGRPALPRASREYCFPGCMVLGWLVTGIHRPVTIEPRVCVPQSRVHTPRGSCKTERGCILMEKLAPRPRVARPPTTAPVRLALAHVLRHSGICGRLGDAVREAQGRGEQGKHPYINKQKKKAKKYISYNKGHTHINKQLHGIL